MIVHFHKKFYKSFESLDPKIRHILVERLRIFKVNPHDTKLNNHALKGKWLGYRSINISGDFRALYREISNDEVIFSAIGTHSQLYK